MLLKVVTMSMPTCFWIVMCLELPLCGPYGSLCNRPSSIKASFYLLYEIDIILKLEEIKPRFVLPRQGPNTNTLGLIFFHMDILSHLVKAKNHSYESLDGHLKERSSSWT